jgi:hypothetical protein
MRDETVRGLRGFDSYEVRLGDELRGERASLGKSLIDVQRELKIKAAYVDAIEMCDASVFPNRGYVAGYVRAYARYLGLDADTVYARFCAESGFEGTNGDMSGVRSARGAGAAARRTAGKEHPLGRSRFRRPAQSGLSLAAASGLGSVLVLAALVVGVGYGGWYLLRDIQRIGFAPVTQLPEVRADPTLPSQPADAAEVSGIAASAADPARDLALRDIYAPRLAAPAIEPRDGPIAAIDPDSIGHFAPGPKAPGAVPPAAAEAPPAAPQPGPIVAAEAPPPPAPQGGVTVLARDSAWVRVFLADGSVIFEKILKPGEGYPVPAGLAEPFLRAGNAGAVFLQVGDSVFGPLGQGTSVVRKVSLDANDVAASWPRAADAGEPAMLPAQSALLPATD